MTVLPEWQIREIVATFTPRLDAAVMSADECAHVVFPEVADERAFMELVEMVGIALSQALPPGLHPYAVENLGNAFEHGAIVIGAFAYALGVADAATSMDASDLPEWAPDWE